MITTITVGRRQWLPRLSAIAAICWQIADHYGARVAQFPLGLTGNLDGMTADWREMVLVSHMMVWRWSLLRFYLNNFQFIHVKKFI